MLSHGHGAHLNQRPVSQEHPQAFKATSDDYSFLSSARAVLSSGPSLPSFLTSSVSVPHLPPAANINTEAILVSNNGDDSLSNEPQRGEWNQNYQQQFALRKVSLDTAVAPLVPRPVAPFCPGNNERKRAFTSASYYSECFLNSISPLDADSAALDAQVMYEKWWVKTKKGASTAATKNGEEDEVAESRKKRKVSFVDAASVNEVCDSIQCEAPPNQTASTLLSETKRNESVAFLPESSNRQTTLIRDIPFSTNDTGAVSHIVSAKMSMTEELKRTGGDTTTNTFFSCLNVLHACYAAQGWDARWGLSTHDNSQNNFESSFSSASPYCLDGNWLDLSKPTYSGGMGRNDDGDYMYTLGRMSFDMFRPTQLKCSIQGEYNSICPRTDVLVKNRSHFGSKRSTNVPRAMQSLLTSVISGSEMDRRNKAKPPVRHYDVAAAFTIAANQTRTGMPPSADTPDSEFVLKKPLQCLLTNHGYCVPDPDTPNRLSIWFSGGNLKVQNEEDLSQWRQLFDESHAPRRDMREYARLLAAQFLLGAQLYKMDEEDGSLSYELKRPIGGHGQVFCDILYCDNDLRIARGHRGSIFVFRRMPNSGEH